MGHGWGMVKASHHWRGLTPDTHKSSGRLGVSVVSTL